MATTLPLEYPVDLPCPSSADMGWVERRELSSGDLPGPRAARPLFTDRLGGQDLLFFFRTRPLLQEWIDWFETVRGNWFAASWPQPQGGIGVRRFRGEPRYSGFMPRRGGWAVSITCQIRGRGELPVIPVSNCPEAIEAAELAQSEIPLVYKYRAGDPVPNPPVGIVGTYVSIERLIGASVGPTDYEFHYTPIAWDDLPDLSTVGIFNDTRSAADGQHRAYITITDLPAAALATCKTIVWQTSEGSGGPTGLVFVNSLDSLAADVFLDVPTGNRILNIQIVLRVSHGVLTATKV